MACDASPTTVNAAIKTGKNNRIGSSFFQAAMKGAAR
jgi:hypothetical protein